MRFRQARSLAPRLSSATPWVLIAMLVISLVIALVVQPEHHSPLDWTARGMFVAAVIGQLAMMVDDLARPMSKERDA
ncbi:hypothetical protein [Curtobacterium sp. MCBD17_030]|uniref:hypothetical protein n=1 Tax=Curtobacterium sp. MCBD17_030 TaxID=2175649 RepID=UPI0011B60E5B|nr:hypothetical protein [Curtobacterium sp. MCBD17_030]